MSKARKILGRRGEDIAVEYLLKQEYKIVKRNFSNKLVEIDIIATKGNVLVFIEVKTRTSDTLGPPILAINYPKRKQLIKMAKSFIYMDRKCRKYFASHTYRIDGIGILCKGEAPVIQHFENIAPFDF
jgi:putative endonuclease